MNLYIKLETAGCTVNVVIERFNVIRHVRAQTAGCAQTAGRHVGRSRAAGQSAQAASEIGLLAMLPAVEDNMFPGSPRGGCPY